ncbi:MAG TPA: hypothetical protein VHR45_05695 [Thermoanaerobaculia bacterium]|nr:hypothetical protein [Thermoanaerobaculia bacterium]
MSGAVDDNQNDDVIGEAPETAKGGQDLAADPEFEISAADQVYFLAVEKIFLEVRGAPLMLVSADWPVARRWRRLGMPLEFVRRALEEVFARRKQRGIHPKVRLASLRYCAPAVEAAWEELNELTGPGRRSAAPPLEIAPRLAALAAALPAGLAGRERWVARLLALAHPRSSPARLGPAPTGSSELDPQEVEERLAELDHEMLEQMLAELDSSARQALAALVEKTLAGLAGRLPEAEIERSRSRLLLQVARRELGLPLLSLFAPEAQA